MEPNFKIPADKILNFMYAGDATFTIKSKATDKHFTFRVIKPKNIDKDLYFVKLMTGPDNTSDFSFFGTVFNRSEFKHSAKARITPDALGVKSFNWFLRHAADPNLAEQVELYHEGFCCRCGRKLTTPESIELGIGPECRKHNHSLDHE